METGKKRKIFKKKPGLCWDNYFSDGNIFYHSGKKGYGILSTVRRDSLPKGVPVQYTHKKVTYPGNLFSKCSRFNEPIIMVHKKKDPENNSIYDKVHVSLQSTSSCNIQSVNMISKCSVFDQAK